MTCDPAVCRDETCPCQDGDPCHYLDLPGSPAMRRWWEDETDAVPAATD